MLIRCGDEPQLSQFTLGCNTAESGLFSNVHSASRLGLPEVEEAEAHGIPAVICGGGPSLEDTLVNIRALKAAGAKVFALNGTAKFLSERGIVPDYQVIIDPRPDNIDFVTEAWADEALLCSQCHPDMFDLCERIAYPVRLWHPGINDLHKAIPRDKPLMISVSLTVGLSVLSLAHTMGYRELHLFGYDSSHRKERSHAYGQPRNADDEMVRCCVDSQVFYSSMAMAGQANQFKQLHDMLVAHGATIKVYGEGLVPALYNTWQRDQQEKILTAVYDLGVSPPTYDFLSFLIEAERYRIVAGYTSIDVLFQPGPMHGFRDDDLPPDAATREGMLWRVCVAMARLLPSVRNVDVKRKRWNVGEDVFPPQYEEQRPLARYATAYLKGGEHFLRASDFARSQAKRLYGQRYATITLRQAAYWPERNSDIQAWERAAVQLWTNGIRPVFIPDTDSKAPEGWDSNVTAAWDLDLRAALYEGAVVNMGVMNGPVSLLPYLGAPYLIFKPVVESAPATTMEFWNAHGYAVGDSFGGNGRIVWEPDTEAVILRELRAFLTEKTS